MRGWVNSGSCRFCFAAEALILERVALPVDFGLSGQAGLGVEPFVAASLNYEIYYWLEHNQ